MIIRIPFIVLLQFTQKPFFLIFHSHNLFRFLSVSHKQIESKGDLSGWQSRYQFLINAVVKDIVQVLLAHLRRNVVDLGQATAEQQFHRIHIEGRYIEWNPINQNIGKANSGQVTTQLLFWVLGLVGRRHKLFEVVKVLVPLCVLIHVLVEIKDCRIPWVDSEEISAWLKHLENILQSRVQVRNVVHDKRRHDMIDVAVGLQESRYLCDIQNQKLYILSVLVLLSSKVDHPLRDVSGVAGGVHALELRQNNVHQDVSRATTNVQNGVRMIWLPLDQMSVLGKGCFGSITGALVQLLKQLWLVHFHK